MKHARLFQDIAKADLGVSFTKMGEEIAVTRGECEA